MKKRLFSILAIFTIATSTIVSANSGYVFSVGANLPSTKDESAIDTRQEARDAANNLANAGYSKKIVTSNIGSDTITLKWLDSDLLYLSGHGERNAVLWIDDDNGLNYRVANYSVGSEDLVCDITDHNFVNTKLAIIAACYGGLSNGLAHSFELQGADASIGWTKVVDNYNLHDYTKTLTSYLGDGLTIQNSIKSTNADMLKKLHDTSSVFKYQTYGQVYVPITKNRNMSSDDNSLKTIKGYISIDNDNYQYLNGDDTEIVSYINEELFRRNEIFTIPGDDTDLILTYRYQIGNIDTDFGYNVNIENNEVKGIWISGEKIYSYDVPMSISKDLVNDIKEKAIQDSNISDEIVEQNVITYFDSIDKKLVYKVETTYQDASNGVYCIETTY